MNSKEDTSDKRKESNDKNRDQAKDESSGEPKSESIESNSESSEDSSQEKIIILAEISQHEYESGEEVAKREKTHTRKVIMARGQSPIVGDPLMLPPVKKEPMSNEEKVILKSKNYTLNYRELPIGVGKFGAVYDAYYVDPNKEGRIVRRVIKKSLAFRQAWAEYETLLDLGREHPKSHIIKFYDMFLIGAHMYIVMQYANWNNLQTYIDNLRRKGDHLDESDMYELIAGVHNGVSHMHRYGYAHRDLKTRNVLISKNKSNPKQPYTRIGDFGSTRKYFEFGEKHTPVRSTTVIGSPQTMAPEVIDTPYDPFVADVYSFGVIVYVVAHEGDHPFNLPDPVGNADAEQVIKTYAVLKRNPQDIVWSAKISAALIDLLKELLEPDPHKRILWMNIQNTEWIRPFNEKHENGNKRE